MENLYIETNNGNIPIDKNVQKKYNLEKGTITPFTGERIVGENGDFKKGKYNEDEKKTLDNIVKEEGVVENEDGVMMTQAEIIDFSHGADSYEQSGETP